MEATRDGNAAFFGNEVAEGWPYPERWRSGILPIPISGFTTASRTCSSKGYFPPPRGKADTPRLAAIKGGGDGQLRLIVERYSRVILGQSSGRNDSPQARRLDCSESDLILASENYPNETFNVSVAVPRLDDGLDWARVQ